MLELKRGNELKFGLRFLFSLNCKDEKNARLERRAFFLTSDYVRHDYHGHVPHESQHQF